MSKSEKKSFDEGLPFELLVIIFIAFYFPIVMVGPYLPKFPMIVYVYVNLSAIIYVAGLICCLKMISSSRKSGYVLLCVSITSLFFYVIFLFPSLFTRYWAVPITQILLLINSIIFIFPRRKIENEKSLYKLIDITTMFIIIIFAFLAPIYISPA